MDLVIFPDSRPRIRIKISRLLRSFVYFVRTRCMLVNMNELQSGNG